MSKLIQDASNDLFKNLKNLETVVGTGLKKDNEITVYLENLNEISQIPKEFEGFKIVTEVTGKFHAL